MKVHAKNKEYCGVSAGVPFVNGVGETDNQHLLNWFASHGYEVEKPEKKGKAENGASGNKA